MDELERAGRALRDSVAAEAEPNRRVRARARRIVRHRRMLAAGSVAVVVVAAAVGIGIAAQGSNKLGVHTITPAGSSTTRTARVTRPVVATVPTTAPRNVVDVVNPLVAFVDPLHGWRIDPVQYLSVEHTSDGGRSWTAQASIPATGTSLNGVLAIDNDHAFALVFDGVGNLTATLMRTTDGLHWSPTAGVGLPAPLASVSFVDASNGWGLTRFGGLVSTTDGGDHWHAMAQPDPADVASGSGEVGGLCLAGNGAGWAATGTAVYRSDDDGATWRRQLHVSMGGDPTLVCKGAHAAYAAFEGGAGQYLGTFVRTDDAGAHWQPLTVDHENGAQAITTVTAPGFPQNQARGDPEQFAPDGTLLFHTGCLTCPDEQNWVVTASPTNRFVVAHFDSTAAHQVVLLTDAMADSDPTDIFVETQTITGDGTGPRPVQFYASTDGGRTWHLRWTGQ